MYNITVRVHFFVLSLGGAIFALFILKTSAWKTRNNNTSGNGLLTPAVKCRLFHLDAFISHAFLLLLLRIVSFKSCIANIYACFESNLAIK